jgi:phage gpG-like protein
MKMTTQVIGKDAVLLRIGNLSGNVHNEVVKTVTRLAIALQAEVKQKLSGEVLHTVTGTLRRSINYSVLQDLSSVVASVGTNVVYAAAHEYGFTGNVTVRAHIRRSKARMLQATKQYVNKFGVVSTHVAQTGKFGKKSGDIQVVSFTRAMNMPERSYLRSSLRESSGNIRQELMDAARRGAKK